MNDANESQCPEPKTVNVPSVLAPFLLTLSISVQKGRSFNELHLQRGLFVDWGRFEIGLLAISPRKSDRRTLCGAFYRPLRDLRVPQNVSS